MSAPRTVLLTGGIGSGKSAVAALLRAKGYPVYDCDAAAKAVYDRHPALVAALEEALGTRLRDASGAFDRQALAAVIFSDPAALSAVEARVHPVVLEDFLSWRASQTARTAFLESAIARSKPLFDGSYDAVLLVTAPEPVRVARVISRDGTSAEAVQARIRAQRFDLLQADAVVNNDLDGAVLEERLEIALKLLHLHR